MSDHTKAAKRVALTPREIYLLEQSIRIASEDGSIYGGADANQRRAINAELEVLRAKLARRSVGGK